MTGIPAGDFGTWLRTTAHAWEAGTDVEVPCGECTACCRAGMFVHVGPTETRTLARIPRAIRFPAPGRPSGWVVLPHDEHGRCAMLVDDRCSIYEDRPLTCRHFDCRVYVAASIAAPAPIADRVAEWRFEAMTDEVSVIATGLEGSDTDRAAQAVTVAVRRRR